MADKTEPHHGDATQSKPAAPGMPAPGIPNLLSRLGPPRAGRGGRRGGLRGLRGGSHHGNHGHGHGYGSSVPSQGHNAIIQNTDTDAALSRLSAVDLGLLEDPFAKFFAGDGGPAPRRLPIINRGTYTRTQALDSIIRAFLTDPSATTSSATSSEDPSSSSTPTRQVVSLGAGTDTRFFRMVAQNPDLYRVGYHEIDFPVTCVRKRNIVQSVPYVRSVLGGTVIEDVKEAPDTHSTAATTTTTSTPLATSWHVDIGRGNTLWNHGLDLRDLASDAQTSAGAVEKRTLKLPGLRDDVPTLLVSECCLCYLQPDAAAGVLRWFADLPFSLGVVVYEPIRPDDAFGRTMVANLASRGITMPTLPVYIDGPTQEARLRREASLTHAHHKTIEAIWNEWVPDAEKDRVNGLDGLDEVEEWELLSSHYVVAWGSRGDYFTTAWASLYST